MRITRFLSWSCLVLALTSTALAQTAPAPQPASMEPAAAPAATPTPAPDATGAPGITTGDPLADPAAAPADPYGAPAAQTDPAEEPAPAAQPAPEPEPASAPAPTPVPVYSEAPTEAPEDRCVLGTFCFGPMLSLGVFNVVGFGVHGRVAEHFGFAVDFQFLPSIGVDDISAGLSLFTMTGRWHIAGSSFFLGAGFSYQSFYAEGSLSDGMGQSAKIEASVGIPQLMFGLGVLGGQGFVMGIDLAFGVPLGSLDVEFTGDMPEGNAVLVAMYEDNRDSIETVAETFLETLPATFQLNLIRIGYIF